MNADNSANRSNGDRPPDPSAPGGADMQDDPIELWGRRIARGLAAVAAAGLLVYLILVYVVP